MPESAWDAEVQSALEQAYQPGVKLVYVGNRNIEVLTPFPSPIDWRDTWIYFMMIDRFNNPSAQPHHQPWDQPRGEFQGGTFAGIKQQLDYLQELGGGSNPVISLIEELPVLAKLSWLRNSKFSSC